MDALLKESDSDDIPKIKKEISGIATLFNGLEKIKLNDPNFLQKIENYLKKVPTQEEIPRLYENLKKLERLVQQSNDRKIGEFQKKFTAYLTNLNELKIDYKINDTYSIRVGCLEIQGKPENATVSIFYNRSVIIHQKPVNSSEDIKTYVKDSMEKLSKSKIEEKLLIDLVYRAYSTLCSERAKQNPEGANRVPIIDLYKEIIVQLIKNEVWAKKTLNFKLKDFSFPEWAFLYNLDRYKILYDSIPENKRLIFGRGSQEQTKEIGVVLNGLNPNLGYEKFSYVSGRG
jgi:hypothetical protein